MKDQDHANQHKELLVGKTIESVRYMTKEEAEQIDWYSRPLVIQFTDGTILYPQKDDEGNNGGAMAIQKESKTSVVYTLGLSLLLFICAAGFSSCGTSGYCKGWNDPAGFVPADSLTINDHI